MMMKQCHINLFIAVFLSLKTKNFSSVLWQSEKHIFYFEVNANSKKCCLRKRSEEIEYVNFGHTLGWPGSTLGTPWTGRGPSFFLLHLHP